ncbi:ketose-bisphosphate aldolase [Phycicoccus endophyticus]|uniref:Ketose-bisphosphate aldolase n=1 Tax=Phycicoccus endophyticus TaxID=1690220 RepID=A0A7G9QYN3_9MICO|nr:ketose-bisphosphate aldolase [Phycicoccus endophyticus]NHI20507.1 ketose-bisphosphate aldolase [Phycicoccus endophyticus]QNN48458.1 ketose-bisphosphate aldolase [Phycicoccus endophyticus]GGL30190.1 fructose-1,6-bisphosphate aldolase [Phycicoccus endophyticus]
MPLITLRHALDAARDGGYAIGAFNVSDLIQAEAVLDAAELTDSPVIVETLAGVSSHGEDARYWSGLLHLIGTYPDLPVVLHLDHGPDATTCRRAVDHGFSSVMIDGSLGSDGRPSSFEANVEVTAEVVEYAHAAGVSVEGELGTIGGSKVDGSRAEIVLADPEQAREFVDRTGVDALAVAIGTSHGAYKFDTPPDGSVLHMDLIRRIAERVPGTHLVMHGSSSLPADLREQNNRFGASLPQSWGVPDEEKERSVSMGVRKINQGMDSHLAFTGAVREALARDGLSVDPAQYLGQGRQAMQDLVAVRMRLFGQAGRADDLRNASPAPATAGGAR